MLLLLALTLGLDSLRASLALGATRLSPARRLKLALAFGLCDGLAPLAGALAGRALVDSVGVWGERLGPLTLGGYGMYVTYVALRCAGRAGEEESPWILWGIPLSLSVDNLIAGASLERIDLPVVLSAAVIGATSGVLSLVGLRLAGLALDRMKVRTEVVGGIALVLIALTLAIECD